MVESLLEKGADVEHINSEGNTPLNVAAKNGHLPLVELLLERGADVEMQSLSLSPRMISGRVFGLLCHLLEACSSGGRQSKSPRGTRRAVHRSSRGRRAACAPAAVVAAAPAVRAGGALVVGHCKHRR